MKIGDKVYFGRDGGEQTLGEIVKINRVKVKVKQLDSRGTYRAHPIGSMWSVPVSLLTPAEGSAPPVLAKTAPAASVPPVRTEAEVLTQIRQLYCSLSPENLNCDGEISRSQAARRATTFRDMLRGCFRELGRTVSEEEAFRSV